MRLETFLLGCACGAACYGLVMWIKRAVPRPDPWGPEVDHALEESDPAPVCPHCLVPQEHNGWFCPQCGNIVSQYGNLLPMVYPFAVGEVVRSGVNGRLRWSPLVVLGYILLALGNLSILAPFYLLALFLQIHWASRGSQEANSLVAH